MRLFATFVMLAAALSAADPAQAVMEASRGWREAAIKKDAAGLQRYLAHDMIYNHADGHAQNKSEYIAAVVGSGRYELFTDSEPRRFASTGRRPS